MKFYPNVIRICFVHWQRWGFLSYIIYVFKSHLMKHLIDMNEFLMWESLLLPLSLLSSSCVWNLRNSTSLNFHKNFLLSLSFSLPLSHSHKNIASERERDVFFHLNVIEYLWGMNTFNSNWHFSINSNLPFLCVYGFTTHANSAVEKEEREEGREAKLNKYPWCGILSSEVYLDYKFFLLINFNGF